MSSSEDMTLRRFDAFRLIETMDDVIRILELNIAFPQTEHAKIVEFVDFSLNCCGKTLLECRELVIRRFG